MTDYMHPAIPLIKGFEGYRAKPYWDVNHYRVGYGSDTITKPNGAVQSVQPGMSVTQDDADRDLQRRVADSHAELKDTIGESAWNSLGPNAQASLTSVHYNYGHLPWNVQQAATTGDPAKLATAISGLSGDNNGINAARRSAEASTALGLGTGETGRFGLNGVSGTTPQLNRPNVSGSGTNSATGNSSDLLSALLNGANKNRVPAYAPGDGKSFAQSPLEGMIRAAAGQGTYTPPIVAKLNGISGGLNSLFGGNQASQGSAPAPGAPTSNATASPAVDAPPTPPPVSEGQASAGGGTYLPNGPFPVVSDMNGNAVTDMSSALPKSPSDLANASGNASDGPGFLDSLKGLFSGGGNA